MTLTPEQRARNGLEASLAKDNPRALIPMATGAGKTFTACTFSWRLLKYANARRILFRVDRNNLGDQTADATSNCASSMLSRLRLVKSPRTRRRDRLATPPN